ncbi:RPM1-interacting protein 4 [Tanacetum coccineum]
MQITRERQGKLPIIGWERMERELRRRFLSPNHDQILFNLLQHCAQGDRTVEVYTAEFHRLLSWNSLSETESQQVTRYINGLRPQIHDKISLVPIYTLDDAYNLAIRAENQLARSSILIKSVLIVDPSLQHTTKISSIDIRKQVVSTNTTTTKTTNPYARPVKGKCFKCGVLGHRSNDCRANGGKVNLTLRDEEFNKGRETNSSDEDVDANAEICHPEGGDYTTTEYSAHFFVIQHILLASKNIVSRDIVQRLRLRTEKHPNPYKVGWIKSVGDIKVTERCKIPFKIGKYKDEIMFDITDMDACHNLLGRPWVYDVNATHKGKENTYTFHHDGVKMVLVPLSDGYNTNVSSSAECSAKGTGSVEDKVKKK